MGWQLAPLSPRPPDLEVELAYASGSLCKALGRQLWLRWLGLRVEAPVLATRLGEMLSVVVFEAGCDYSGTEGLWPGSLGSGGGGGVDSLAWCLVPEVLGVLGVLGRA